MSELAYYKWWRRNYRSQFPKLKVIERLTNKLWIRYNDICLVRQCIDRALAQF